MNSLGEYHYSKYRRPDSLKLIYSLLRDLMQCLVKQPTGNAKSLAALCIALLYFSSTYLVTYVLTYLLTYSIQQSPS